MCRPRAALSIGGTRPRFIDEFFIRAKKNFLGRARGFDPRPSKKKKKQTDKKDGRPCLLVASFLAPTVYRGRAHVTRDASPSSIGPLFFFFDSHSFYTPSLVVPNDPAHKTCKGTRAMPK
jgi:hypothetical protein